MTTPILCAHCQGPVPAPCVDCEGLAGPELGWPGMVWLAALCGVSVDDVMEAATW